MNAKCCFQIWIKKDIQRQIIKYNTTHPDFNFINYGPKDKNNQPTPPLINTFDFAIRAYGSNCGRIITENLTLLRPKSYHFIKSNIDIELLKKRFMQLDYSISTKSVRQDSLGKGELINLYEKSLIKN